MFLLNALVGLATLATCSQFHALEKRQSSETTSYNGPLVPSFNMSLPVDHFNQSDTRTYNNRYWVNDTYYQPGGPVFFYDYGQAGVSDEQAAYALAELNRPTAIMTLARQYNGLAVLWEHRYYGFSDPVPFEVNATAITPGLEPVDAPQAWSYLTIEQSLEDVVYFANNLQSGGYQTGNISALAPSNTPWIWVGSNYGAGLGALARIRNPEVIYAVWASSAPVEASFDGSTYYNEIERSLPSNCTADVRAVVAYVDQILDGDSTSQEYIDVQRYMYLAAFFGWSSIVAAGNFSAYNLSDADSYDPFTIGNALSLPFTIWVEPFGPSLAQNILCNYLESYNPEVPGNTTDNEYISVLTNPGNAQPSAEGFLASHGNNLTLGLQAMTFAIGQYWNYAWTTLSPLGTAQPSPTYQADFSSAQYQFASQVGWYQASNPDNVTIISKYYNYTALHDYIINFQFSQATMDALPAQPDVESANKYGGLEMNPSNVMFTVGEFDPWRAASALSREQNSPGNQPTNEVPACGTSPANGTRYGAVYPNAGNQWDMYEFETVDKFSVDSQGNSPLQAGLELFTAALDVWLPCFNGSGGSENVTGPAPFTGQATHGHGLSWMMVGTVVAAVVALMTL